MRVQLAPMKEDLEKLVDKIAVITPPLATDAFM